MTDKLNHLITTQKYIDSGPFTRSRYASDDHLYLAMNNYITHLELVNKVLKQAGEILTEALMTDFQEMHPRVRAHIDKNLAPFDKLLGELS